MRRAVCVYICSTFRDMHAEREHLGKSVFPALRERLEKYGLDLIEIDIRWGVTEEEAERGKVLDLLFGQIDRCRPFFIGILGERYGWIPPDFPEEALLNHEWLRSCIGKSSTELEILYAAFVHPQRPCKALFYLRDPSVLRDVPEEHRMAFLPESEESAEKLARLKARIRASDYHVMDPYPARWDPQAYDALNKWNGRIAGLEEFGKRVHDQLWEAIKAELDLPEVPPIELDPLIKELEDQELFIQSRLAVYVNRREIENLLFSFVDSHDPVPCIVTGPPGSGKSAVLARFVEAYRMQYPDALVIPHFVGASLRSTSLRDMLERFCRELASRFAFPDEIPQALSDLRRIFRGFLARIPANERVILVIDGLDQLDPIGRAHELGWLPLRLPSNIRCILSVATDPGPPSPALDAMRSRVHYEIKIPLLSIESCLDIAKVYLHRYAKKLDPLSINMLLEKTAARNPLYLQVALEELRIFGQYELIRARIQALPSEGDSVTHIFEQVIERMEGDFGGELVRTVLVLIASARRGLSERELQDLVVNLDARDNLLPVLRQP
ncbi:MAG: DUF4062 domain-containing protein [Candidatus Methanoperedens sp.]|nr:DUF4062 domain-containing protein [Candidatus Methanoperedens sp.]